MLATRQYQIDSISPYLSHLQATGCSALSQDWLEGKRAVFRTDCAESDIAAAQRYSYPSIGRRSCLKDYHAGRERQQARKRPKRLPREER